MLEIVVIIGLTMIILELAAIIYALTWIIKNWPPTR